MKSLRGYVAAVLGLSVFALCGSAQALNFTVSDIAFTDVVGYNEAFRWTVTPQSVSPFSLNTSANQTFTYGTFFTDDFPINNPASDDSDDSFLANFRVTPPGGDRLSRIGVPDAVRVQTAEGYASVDFNNDWINVIFGTDGLYRVKFLDVAIFSTDLNGTQNLQATLEFLRAPTTNSGIDNLGPTPIPTPEPSTMVLLGSGLLGLIYVGRKRSRK